MRGISSLAAKFTGYLLKKDSAPWSKAYSKCFFNHILASFSLSLSLSLFKVSNSSRSSEATVFHIISLIAYMRYCSW
jgi:hypothetical protein